MIDDPFLNFLIGVVCCSVLALVWVISGASIANDCRTMGSFRISDTVFECKIKGKQ